MALIYYCCACVHSFSNKKAIVDMSHDEMTKIMMVAVPESNITDIKDPVICKECFQGLKIAYDLKMRYNKTRKETNIIPQDTEGEKVKPCSIVLQRVDEEQVSHNK